MNENVNLTELVIFMAKFGLFTFFFTLSPFFTFSRTFSTSNQFYLNLDFCCLGWIGYTDEYRRQLCKKYIADGFDAFKLKVGQNLEDDRHRCRLVRQEIGWDKKLVRKKVASFNLKYAIWSDMLFL